jgi:hypothetical protein
VKNNLLEVSLGDCLEVMTLDTGEAKIIAAALATFAENY